MKLYKVDSGEIKVLGMNVENVSTKELRKIIGYANQDTIILNDTVLNNITLENEEITMEQVIGAAKIANIHDFVMSLPNKYNTVLGEGGSILSGGQKQCVALARTIVRNPSILILDEATSAMDSVTEYKVISEIKQKIRNKALIIISHNKSLEEFADDVITQY